MSQPADLFETKSDYAYRQVRDRILSGESSLARHSRNLRA